MINDVIFIFTRITIEGIDFSNNVLSFSSV